MTIPVAFTWDGDAMVPLKRFRRLCDQQYVIGQDYVLVEEQQRSRRSHDHFFASVDEAWKNLREDVADNFPTPDALRKWALIRAGFRDERSIVCSSKAEARRVAAFIKPMDEYAVVLVRDAVVKVCTAKSQSLKAMGRADFQASKTAVMEILGGMIGVPPETLAREGARSAA